MYIQYNLRNLLMETIAIFYKIRGVDALQQSDDRYNVHFLSIPKGREVLLLDLLQDWAKNGINRICYTFCAEVQRGSCLPLQSPLSLLPVLEQQVHLILTPTAAPPITLPNQYGEWIDYSREQISNPEAYQVNSWPPLLRRQGESTVSHQSVSYHRMRDDKDKREDVFAPPAPPFSGQRASVPGRDTDESQTREREHAKGNSVKKLFQTGAVDAAVLAGAATAASEFTGHAARSLFNFAAKSMKTVAQGVASMTGYIQVGNHRVVVVREIAQGGFGIVMLVRDANGDTLYAMKQMFCQSREQEAAAHLELKMLQKFSGDPHIVSLVDYASLPASKGQHRQILLMFPFFALGTAWDMIADAVAAAEAEQDGDGGLALHAGNLYWPFPERVALATILGTAMALRTMHDGGVAHRDIKPHNILISESFSPVIMDLGSVGPVRVQVRSRMDALRAEDEASIKCSAPYRAPELTQVNKECDLDGKVDVWSLGCTMYCLAFGNSPFENSKEGVLKLAILNAKYSVPAKNKNMCGFVYSDSYMALVHRMLQLNPADRPDMDQVVQDCEWLQSQA